MNMNMTGTRNSERNVDDVNPPTTASASGWVDSVFRLHLHVRGSFDLIALDGDGPDRTPQFCSKRHGILVQKLYRRAAVDRVDEKPLREPLVCPSSQYGPRSPDFPSPNERRFNETGNSAEFTFLDANGFEPCPLDRDARIAKEMATTGHDRPHRLKPRLPTAPNRALFSSDVLDKGERSPVP